MTMGTGIRTRLLLAGCVPVLLLATLIILSPASRELLTPVVALATISIIAVAVGFSVTTARRMEQAVNGMIGTLSRLAQSDFAARAELGGPGELRALEQSLNFAADTVQHNRTQLLRQVRQSRHRLRRTVAALRRSEQTYRDLFENATDIVFTTDLSGHFLDGNRAVRRLLGYTVTEAKDLTWERLVAADHMQRAKQMLRRHARGERQISFELDVITKRGAVRTFEIGSRPMYRKGRLAGFHGIARDVTERIIMQRELVEARRVAEDASKAKSTFLANMSHEIRTPINGMLGYTRLLTETSLSPRQREYLEPVKASACHLLKIINDILDLSKIEAGHLEVTEEVIDPKDVVRSAVDLLRPLAQAKGLSLQMNLADRTPDRLLGDGTRIGQVVGNLVNNAVKFTHGGSVTVSLGVTPGESDRFMMRCVVEDTGIGIPGDAMERILEPFQQSDNRTTRRFGGTGLGLTITRNLVRAMAGRLSIESEPGRFTRATVELPLLACSDGTHAEAGSDGATAAAFQGDGMQVLVVDDNDINCGLLRALMQRFGCQVDTASNGADAVCMATRGYDLVLMDIHMADMDGFEATRRIRAAGADSLPVVAVSADVVGDAAQRCLAGGLDGFLAKPVIEADLLRLLGMLFVERYRPVVPAPVRDPSTEKDLEVLDHELGIEFASGDAELWWSGVVSLMESLPEAAETLREAHERADFGSLGEIAHKMAGSAEYLAAKTLAVSLRELERAAAVADADRANGCLRCVENAISAFEEVARYGPGTGQQA
jgi:PAS domain S-box-containing protein